MVEDHEAWVAANRGPGPVLDLDAHTGEDRQDSAPGTFAAAIARRAYLGLPPAELPMHLAELHRVVAVGGPVAIGLSGPEAAPDRPPSWDPALLEAVCIGAGFTVEGIRAESGSSRPPELAVRLRRARTLADTVGPHMRLLVCGLNPSVYAADAGVAFARPGNRFWPAAIAAGLVSRDRDPIHALRADGIGMTDLVKRATPRAAELTAEEYRDGLARLERLTDWLRPGAVCFVGLAGWRAAVDPRAVAGPQRDGLAGTPVYLMPSTSGLNAHSRLADLTAHFEAAATFVPSPHRSRW